MSVTELNPTDCRRESQNCWVATLPADFEPGDDLDNPSRSSLTVFEDGRELGPAHSDHNRIRVYGGGLFSHWKSNLYFSTSDNASPLESGRRYTVRAQRTDGSQAPASDADGDELFPRLARIEEDLRTVAKSMSLDLLYRPKGEIEDRLRMLEAKVEYVLDELYVAKSQLRHLAAGSEALRDLRKYQISSFDYQWKHLPYHDAFLSNPDWRAKAAADLCERVGRTAEWFAGKRILDCGCGPGRHAWTFASLGAAVTAFDTSDHALESARRECAGFPAVTLEKRNILDPLPYPEDFDLVWCYGVIHCTGDTFGALSNIARHVKLGGDIYFMVYPEPPRTDLASYSYYHQIHVIRQLTRHLDFAAKRELIKKIQGERWALSWFDAISSEINDLYTMEELAAMLGALGFSNVRRTMPNESSHNVVATRSAPQLGR
jgi:SAM-dependent methyltransferase